MKDKKMVVVKWVDSHEALGWTPISELGPCDSKECTTVGILIDKNHSAVMVAGSTAHDPEQSCGTMFIPRENILSINELKQFKPIEF